MGDNKGTKKNSNKQAILELMAAYCEVCSQVFHTVFGRSLVRLGILQPIIFACIFIIGILINIYVKDNILVSLVIALPCVYFIMLIPLPFRRALLRKNVTNTELVVRTDTDLEAEYKFISDIKKKLDNHIGSKYNGELDSIGLYSAKMMARKTIKYAQKEMYKYGVGDEFNYELYWLPRMVVINDKENGTANHTIMHDIFKAETSLWWADMVSIKVYDRFMKAGLVTEKTFDMSEYIPEIYKQYCKAFVNDDTEAEQLSCYFMMESDHLRTIYSLVCKLQADILVRMQCKNDEKPNKYLLYTDVYKLKTVPRIKQLL